MSEIKIYLADDHQLLIDGLISALSSQPHIKVVGMANDGRKVLNEIFQHQPHVLVLDLNMPKVDGLQVIEKIKAHDEHIKVLVLSNYNAPHIIKEVQQKGADGYLVKNGSISELIDAIQTVYDGGLFFDTMSAASHPTKESSYFMDDFLKAYLLTKREHDILLLMARGRSSVEIADSLFISAATVNTHRRNILKKLGLKRTSEVMNLAASKGWLKS